MNVMGKLLVMMGIFLVLVGVFFWIGPKIPFLGKLPGDIYFKKGNFAFYFPVVTCILISIILSLILTLLFGRK
ncbi:MAG TPA: DUF2905 domain-containing protein [Candidatus Aerophobetes bacterium]|uniref:DUF2905 domain-containing protein n=1 Tax=Aerophobetes bacterium TaxID=2030807 RepID=A0A7V5HZ07_UNCAE|nr:DUF2905 domain-containing protein [Candidatus Aerophobetes bacterium]